MKERVAPQPGSIRNVVMLAVLVAVGLTGSVGSTPAPISDTLAQRVQEGKVQDVAPVQVALGAAPAALAPFNAKVAAYYDQLRSKLHWTPVRFEGTVLET